MAPAFGEDDPRILFIRPANLFIRPGHGPVEFGYCLGFYKPTATPQSDGVLPQEPPPHPPPQSTPAHTSRGGGNGRRTTAIRQIVHANLWACRQKGPMRQASCRFWEKAFTRLTHSEVLETLGLAFVAIIFRHRDLNPGRSGESRTS